MPRACVVCTSPDRAAIEAALIREQPFRNIAERFSLSLAGVSRHKAEHLPGHLVQSEQAKDLADADTLMAEIKRIMGRVNLLYDACDRYLRDPEDPSRYDVGPRSDDVQVTYSEVGTDGKVIRKRAALSTLLARLEGTGPVVERAEFRHADPRELLLKTADRLQGQLELLAKLLGELDDRPTINVLLSPEWLTVRTELVRALQPFPDARAAVSACLVALEVDGARRN